MNNNIKIITCLLLTVSALLVFWQVQNHEFVNLDDNLYILDNQHVKSGLNLKNVSWAFTTLHGGFWFPLTWLSHMLDSELYGINPKGHHFNNLLLHIANTILLFLLLNRMTGALWRSAFVAALFAIHPLHVEPVAWVSSRKDVLSTLFWILTIWFYVNYTNRPNRKRYLLVLLFFTLGLMSKPMLVTLPFVLLLLDYWPLARLFPDRSQANHNQPSLLLIKRVHLTKLILEKVPLFSLSIISSVLVFIAEKSIGALVSMKSLPLNTRIANGLVSYVVYIKKMILPANLSVFYPYPGSLPLWQVLGALLLLIFISILVIRSYRTYPYLLVGWLWYLGGLMPVIGLIQVGTHAMADRYTYIPLIGLFIMISWGVSEFRNEWHLKKLALQVPGILLILILMVCAWVQTGYWKDDITLFKHAVSVTNDNYRMHYILGQTLASFGRFQEAIANYRETIRIRPNHKHAYNGIGIVKARQKKYDEAAFYFRKTLEIDPEHETAHTNLGIIFSKQENFEKAIVHFKWALRIKPDHAYEYNNLGDSFLKYGNPNRAISYFYKALNDNSNNSEIHNKLGIAFEELGNIEKAQSHYTEALIINPDHFEAQKSLTILLQKTNNQNNDRK